MLLFLLTSYKRGRDHENNDDDNTDDYNNDDNTDDMLMMIFMMKLMMILPSLLIWVCSVLNFLTLGMNDDHEIIPRL